MTEELLKALQLIKAECEKHEYPCKGCPLLSARGDCGVTTDDPSEWTLKKREVYF